MKRLTTQLFAIFLLASGSLALAATTKNYTGTYAGNACTVQVTWHNWSGLGAIDGTIKLADGTTIPFSGANTRTGVIEFKANGNSFRLVRIDAGRKVSWVSSKFSFTEGAAPTPTVTPTPTPTPTPSPTPEELESKMVEQSYTGSWNGKGVTVQMRWAPGDTPDVLRRGRGTVTTDDGTKFSIEGWQPSAETTEFSLAPDQAGAVYKTTKATKDEGVVWEGASLTLTETK